MSRRRVAVGVAAMLGTLTAVSGAAQADVGPPPADPVPLVNPLIGTLNDGTTIPGATTPFGMVQLSPDTEQLQYAAYKYDDPSILGFAHAHLSGVGCQTMGVIQTMPTTGVVTSNVSLFRSPFSHANESAQAGYYKVLLDKYNVTAELTADTHTGFHRYTFPSSSSSNVLFEVGLANGNTYGADVHVVGDDTIEGWTLGGNFCSETSTDRYMVYFSAKFNRPFASFGTWNGNVVIPTIRDQSTSLQSALGAYAQFDTTAEHDVEVAVGISYTGVAGARLNREQESIVRDGDGTSRPRTFDEVRQAAQDKWRAELGKVAIQGGTPDDQTVFYTALYHGLVHPSVGSDVDGLYRGFDGLNHLADGWTYYQHFSLWDTYRTQNMLVELLDPSRARDMMRSILRIRAEGGWLPRWALATGETNVMSGDPVTAFLSEGWSKGLLSGLEDEAWDAMWQNVNQKPDPTKLKGGQRIRGRDGNDTYTALGWIGYRTTSGYLYGDERKAGSATLEYALSDCALGGLAAALDKSNEAAVLRQRAQNYRNLWDASIGSKGFTGFPRARTSAGAWVGSTDPTVSTGFHEGTPWQYEWLVPQDVEGLFQVMGGRAEAARRLDEFFALDSVVADPYRAAHEQWVVGPYAYNNAWRYNPNNEPDLHVPWLYAWTGQAWKTSAVVRAAQTLFTNQPNGVTGNDDLGEMSAWYVFSALGLYPVMSGSATYVLNAPRFEHAVLTFENGNTLTLNAPGAAGGVQYIQGVRLDGQAFNRTWIDHTTLTGTSRTLDFDLAPGTPAAGDATWGSTVASQPVSLCGSDVTPPTTAASLAPAAVNGWYRNPTVTLTASDAGSGVDRSDYRLDGGAWTTYAAPFPVTGDGEHTLDYRSTDVAGNAETAQSLTFAVDATAPTITIATPAEGGSYLLGSNVSAAYRCADATSALDSCTGPVPDGQPLDTSTVGAHTFTVAARDRAGNERTQTVAYTVIFAFTGFFAPVANPATVNVVKAGSGIPVKFNLGGNQGLAIFAGGYPQSAPISCDPQSKTNTIAAKDTVKATTSSLSYDPKSKQYTYTWATGKNWANSCRQLWLKLTDNTTHAALFKFTR